MQTTAPKVSYRNYFNERKGTLERIPEGITPGFNWNQGLSRDKQVEHALKAKMDAQRAYLQENELFPKKVSKNDTGKMATYIREHFDSKVPNLETLVKNSKSFFTTKEELQESENLKPIAAAIEHLEKNCKDAAFKKIVWGSSDLMSNRAIATFNPFYPDVVFLNILEFNKLSETVKDRFSDKLISTDSPMHYIFHEAGHKWVLKHLTNKYKFIPNDWLSDEDRLYFTENVSWNAGRNPSEAIAELFAMKISGVAISEQTVKRIAKYSKEFVKWLS